MCEQFYSEMKLDHPQIRIHAIDRITNPLLQEQADKWRASKGLANIGTDLPSFILLILLCVAPVEMWHGTGPRGVRGISRRGFDLAFAHGGTCGNAVYESTSNTEKRLMMVCGDRYLAYSPRAAHGYAAMRKDLSSHHTIILCSATLGQGFLSCSCSLFVNVFLP